MSHNQFISAIQELEELHAMIVELEESENEYRQKFFKSEEGLQKIFLIIRKELQKNDNKISQCKASYQEILSVLQNTYSNTQKST
jgi:hypothetical protein